MIIIIVVFEYSRNLSNDFLKYFIYYFRSESSSHSPGIRLISGRQLRDRLEAVQLGEARRRHRRDVLVSTKDPRAPPNADVRCTDSVHARLCTSVTRRTLPDCRIPVKKPTILDKYNISRRNLEFFR